jgi:hypothetical protein|eukprot:COSAG06_NODE_2283_length_7176_cov_3.750318_3_plen_101_part_00
MPFHLPFPALVDMVRSTGLQRDKFWNRWSHEELQQSCLDHGLHPDGAMRFLKDRMLRYDYGQAAFSPDETGGAYPKSLLNPDRASAVRCSCTQARFSHCR